MATKILQGDCIEKMRELPDECVHCCVTSPPYFGLRDYGTASWEGGKIDCEHVGDQRYYTEKTAAVRSADAFSEPGQANVDRLKEGRWRNNGTCVKCGAVKRDFQIGLEKTPEEYVAKMVEVFREVRRVLRSDGCLWLNLGDSYARAGGTDRGSSNTAQCGSTKRTLDQIQDRDQTIPIGFKVKDLLGIPHRVAFALQADGWYLRAICPWLKRNGMPESCRDRPTQVIEYVFLLTKSQKYFYDSEATKKPYSDSYAQDKRHETGPTDRNEKDGYDESLAQNPKKLHRLFNKPKGSGSLRRTSDWFFDSQGLIQDEDGNPLAFQVNTAAYKKAHFATFPPKLIEPCILAGTSAHGCCPECEAPWERVVERTPMVIDRSERTHELGRTRSSGTMVEPAQAVTTGWQPTCDCNGKFVDELVQVEPKSAPESWNGSSFDDGKNLANHPSVGRRDGAARTKTVRVYKSDPPLDQHPVEPCIVLDPFGGSGTTGEVAQKHGRNAVLIELNPAYIPLIKERAA